MNNIRGVYVCNSAIYERILMIFFASYAVDPRRRSLQFCKRFVTVQIDVKEVTDL